MPPPRLALALLLASIPLAPARAGGPPKTVVELFDGSVRDVAAEDGRILLAQGRNLAILDARDGTRLADDPASPFPSTLAAVDVDPRTHLRLVAAQFSLRLEMPDGTAKTWSPAAADGYAKISDAQLVPGTRFVVIVAGVELAVLDGSGSALVPIARTQAPPGACLGFSRVVLARSGAAAVAYVLGIVPHGTVPRVNGVFAFDLDPKHGFANPAYLGRTWSPADAYADPLASSTAIQIDSGLDHAKVFAYVADGTAGVTKLDVSVPGHARLAKRIAIGANAAAVATNLLFEHDRRRMYVAASDGLHVLDVDTDAEIGWVQTELGDGGDRDMALSLGANGTRRLWTATHRLASFPVHGFDVAAATPLDLVRRPWLGSCDGGVAVPAWESIYLPTWSGVVRYDASDLLHPRMVESSYRPADAVTEQLEILWPDPSDARHALLLTAPGNGGVQYWPIAADAPDPGPPRRWTRVPSAWGPNPNVYQNDVEGFRFGGRCYALCDLSNMNTGVVALQAFDIASGACATTFESSPVLHGFSTDVSVLDDFAFVGCRGGFFTVRLDALPSWIAVVGQTLVDAPPGPGRTIVQSIAPDPDRDLLFVATDVRRVVASYAFDPATGVVSGPLGILTDPGLTGCVGRCRYFAATRRLYVASRLGRIAEIDVSDPQHMTFLSSWRSPGYDGPMQDAHVYDFGSGPRILAVKDAEGFAILDPDDGL